MFWSLYKDIDIWWYWVSMGRYWLVLGGTGSVLSGTGSVWGSTVCYLVVLRQLALLIATWSGRTIKRLGSSGWNPTSSRSCGAGRFCFFTCTEDYRISSRDRLCSWSYYTLYPFQQSFSFFPCPWALSHKPSVQHQSLGWVFRLLISVSILKSRPRLVQGTEFCLA